MKNLVYEVLSPYNKHNNFLHEKIYQQVRIHKEHYVDINGLDGRIIHRSNVITNNKILRRVHRAATRKLGVFLLTGRIA